MLLTNINLQGQSVTSADINGVVVTYEREPLPNANVVAVHIPSGTEYGTTTRNDGRFNLPNLRTGGPYEVRASHVGYGTDVISDLILSLGEVRNMTLILIDDGVTLEEVVVIAKRDQIFDLNRTGASTNINNDAINSMPTISRSINDFTRLNPQSNGASFAGRDNRFNNYTIDGNIYNNNFGLGSSQFAGGNPISIEAIEEIQVNIAPYDVRSGGFTGANVNAITKSGTNLHEGSVYFYYRNQDMLGTKIGENELNVDDSFTRILGASAGGPIIQDRLFYFVSIEQESSDNPGDPRIASTNTMPPDGQTVSRVHVDQASFVREKINEIYGYDPGAWDGYGFGNEALRFNFRVDYNINNNNRLALRFNHYEAFRDVTINGNSIRGNFPRYRNTNRFGPEALTFRNANYSVDNNVTSFMAELNSVIGNRYSNSLNVGYTTIEDPKRSIPGGQVFPFIEVLEFEGGTPLYFMSLGNELYSVGNLLANNIFNINNEFSAYFGRHNLMFGLNLELMSFENAFNPAFNTFYRYNSYDSFVQSVINQDRTVLPDGFAMSYAFDGSSNPPMDETRFGQFSVYLQDRFQINQNLVVTGGLRVDVPFFPIDLPNNPRLDDVVSDLSFINPQTGDSVTPDVSVLPSPTPLYSPRLSFNYDVRGDATLQLRGGSGLFSGRIPFVWISNQVNANGVTRGLVGWDPNEEGLDYGFGIDGIPEWNGFQPDPNYYKPDPQYLDAQLSRDVNITDPDFKFPQVWRTNLAVDYRLPFNLIGTLEGIYSKDYNSPLAMNINLADPAGYFDGADQRPYFTSYTRNSQFNEVMMLTNVNKGYHASITAQLQKDFENGLYASFAYTRGVTKDHGLIGGSQAASLWPNEVRENRNDPEIGYGRFDQPNRIVSYVNYNTENIIPNYPTAISLFYTGGESGRYSYVYAGNFGDRAARLMYVPNDASEINFQEVEIGGVTYSPQDQWNILNNYIENSDYLRNNRGNVVERNAATLPWLHRFDLRITQDVSVPRLAENHRLQITLDILNVGNLINSEWGVDYTPWQRALLTYMGRDEDTNQPIYSINSVPGGPDGGVPSQTFREIVNINQTWRAQLGVRYMF